MARIRTIKPEFWTDERVGECSPKARLLFIGTWNIADDDGNLERSAKQIKAQLFPYDSFTCEPLIRELVERGLLTEYEVDGDKYLHINGFAKHQKIDRKSNPRVPAPLDNGSTRRVLDEASTITQQSLAPDRKKKVIGTDHEKERKGIDALIRQQPWILNKIHDELKGVELPNQHGWTAEQIAAYEREQWLNAGSRAKINPNVTAWLAQEAYDRALDERTTHARAATG